MKKILLLLWVILIMGCTSTKVKVKKEHYLIRGMNYSRNKNYTKAIQEYKKFYEIDKKDTRLLGEMGLAYSYLKDFDTAEKYFLEALDVESDNQVIISNIAILYYKMDRIEESKEYIAKISLDSINYKIYLLEGYIAFDNKEYELAYHDFRKVLTLTTISDQVFLEKYVEVLQKTKRTNEIYSFIYKIYQTQKDDPKAAIRYSRYLVDVFNDYNGAFDILKEYIARRKDNEVILELAKRSYEVGELDDCQLYLRLLTDAYKYNIDVLTLKKEIALEKKDYKNAEKYKKIINKVSDKENERD